MEWEMDGLILWSVVVWWLYRPFSSLGGVARVGGEVEPSPFPLSAEEHMGCSPLLHFFPLCLPWSPLLHLSFDKVSKKLIHKKVNRL